MSEYPITEDVKKDVSEFVDKLLRDEIKHEAEEREKILTHIMRTVEAELKTDHHRSSKLFWNSVPLWLFVLLGIWSVGTSFALGWVLQGQNLADVLIPADRIEAPMPAEE